MNIIDYFVLKNTKRQDNARHRHPHPKIFTSKYKNMEPVGGVNSSNVSRARTTPSPLVIYYAKRDNSKDKRLLR